MSQSTSKYTLVATDVCHVWYRPCVHFVNAIPISLICLFSSVKNYIALSLSLSYTSRVMAFKGLSKYFFHWVPCVHFINAIPISLICLFSSVKNYIALSLSRSYTSHVMAFKGLSKYFFSLGSLCTLR